MSEVPFCRTRTGVAPDRALLETPELGSVAPPCAPSE